MGDFLALIEDQYDFVVEICQENGIILDSVETDDMDEAFAAYSHYCEWADSFENEFDLVCVSWFDYTSGKEDIRMVQLF